MANGGALTQTLGSHRPRIVASGWSVWLSPARRYVPLLGRKRSGLCPRRAEWPAGNNDVTAPMDSCTSICRSSAHCRNYHNLSVTGRGTDNLPTGPETWLFRSWGVDSSFTMWDSPILALARPSGVISDHQKGGLFWGGGGLCNLWVLCSPVPRYLWYQEESKAATSQRPTVARRVSVRPVRPNASSGSEAFKRAAAEPQRSGVRMGQKPVQGYAKTRHLDSRESVGGASVPGHSSTARVKNPKEEQGQRAGG